MRTRQCQDAEGVSQQIQEVVSVRAFYVLIQLEEDIYHIHHEDHDADVFPEYNCLLLMNVAILLLNFFVFVF